MKGLWDYTLPALGIAAAPAVALAAGDPSPVVFEHAHRLRG